LKGPISSIAPSLPNKNDECLTATLIKHQGLVECFYSLCIVFAVPINPFSFEMGYDKIILYFIGVKRQIYPGLSENCFEHGASRYEKNIGCFLHVSTHIGSWYSKTPEIR
jgi:hypothetical protein